jgi:ubiquinone/menaquinone biosynthesis C-methylase UbiE
MGIDFVNQKGYARASVVAGYATSDYVLEEERIILDKYQTSFRDKRVLELGCGGGRIVAPILQLTSDYTGLDYSEGMIRAAQARFPDVHFILGDAADLSMIPEASIDSVLFAFNGLDCMSHARRLRCLKEVRRVLMAGGLFAFSTHNRDYSNRVEAWDRSDINLFRNIKNALSYALVRKHQVRGDDYEILSDPLAGFTHLTYNISVSDQIEQLSGAGFDISEIYNRNARPVAVDDLDTTSNFLYYVCHKTE